MKKFANNNWKLKAKINNRYTGKKFQVEYFYSFSDQPMFKVVNAEDSQQAIAKFQEAVRWNYEKIGKIMEVLK